MTAYRICPTCNGRKNIRVHDPDLGWEVVICPTCNGSGEVEIKEDE